MITSAQLYAAVLQLHARYADAVMQRDGEQYAACWHEQAQWHFLGELIQGRENIKQRWLQAIEAFPVIVHQQFSCVLTAVEAQRLSTRTYVYEDIIDAEGKAISFLGTYVDEIEVLASGECRYLERRFELAHQGQGSLRPSAWLGFSC